MIVSPICAHLLINGNVLLSKAEHLIVGQRRIAVAQVCDQGCQPPQKALNLLSLLSDNTGELYVVFLSLFQAGMQCRLVLRKRR